MRKVEFMKRWIEQNSGEIPAGFIKCEYIESTGSQWINTGISVTDAYGFKLDSQLIHFINNEYFGGGTYYNNGLGIATYGSNTFGFVMGNEMCRFIIDYVRHVYEIRNFEPYIDNVVMQNFKSGSHDLLNRNLFIFRHSGTNSDTCSYRCFMCSIQDFYSNDLGYFIPVLCTAGTTYIDGNMRAQVTASADKPGMYDKISRRFFVNQGQGEDFLYKLA